MLGGAIASLIQAATIILGIISIVVSFTMTYRKEEAEISKDALRTPFFKVGVVLMVIGIALIFIL